MTSLAELRGRVVAAYDDLGLPSWPNPHPSMRTPLDEEYSRVTAPERYRIVHARARVWADQLSALPGVSRQELAPVPTAPNDRWSGYDRGVRLTSSVEGTLPLLLLERDAPLTDAEGILAVTQISVVRPEVVVDAYPDCGCDACDCGSDDLLEAIDEAIRIVIGGPLAILRGPGWDALWHPEGGRSGGAGTGPDHRRMMALCQQLAAGEPVAPPAGAEVLVGRSWLAPV